RGAAVAGGLPAVPRGPAHLGSRGPRQPARRRPRRAEAPAQRAAARLWRLRALGPAGEVRRVQPVGDRLPRKGWLMSLVRSLGYLRVEATDIDAWRAFGVKVLGL